jgi:hypothetical protein
MTTIPTLTHTQYQENVIHHLLGQSLPDAADPDELTKACTAFVSVLVETDDREIHAALCERLLHGLHQLRAHCDNGLPSYLVEQVVAGEKLNTCVPERWQDASLQVITRGHSRTRLRGRCQPVWQKNSPGYCMIWFGCWRNMFRNRT